MHYAIGAILVLGGLMMISPVQNFFYGIIAKKYNIPRSAFSLVAFLSLVMLTFLIVPHFLWQFVLGAIFIAISFVMMLVVPKNQAIRTWVEAIYFGENDILDEDAPYYKVVNLFKIPLLGLGIWVIWPGGLIVLDFGAVIFAFICWYNQSKTAEKQSKFLKTDLEVVDFQPHKW